MYAEKQIMMILKCRAGYGIFSEEMDLSHCCVRGDWSKCF